MGKICFPAKCLQSKGGASLLLQTIQNFRFQFFNHHFFLVPLSINYYRKAYKIKQLNQQFFGLKFPKKLDLTIIKLPIYTLLWDPPDKPWRSVRANPQNIDK